MSESNPRMPRAIILITLDACRADHVGCYGYPLDTTPTLDALASESVRFQHAFSPIGLTAPSHTSLLTGKYPRFHSIGFHNGDRRLNREQEVTLPTILQDLGYQTAAFVSIMPLQLKLSGLGPGFDTYDDAFTHGELNRPNELRRDAHQTTRAVLEWLGHHKDRPFFLWVHYSEPHGPYMPPAPYDTEFVGDKIYGPPRTLRVAGDNTGGIPAYQVLKPNRDTDGKLLDYEQDYRYYVSQYDGQIRFVDEHLKTLMQKLREWHLFDDTLLIVTADHGESLGENNIYFMHSLTVSLEQISVPLFIKPSLSTGSKAKTVVSPVTSLDIMPTVLALCGTDTQYLGIQGTDLSPFLQTNADVSWPNRYIFSEIPCQLSVVNGQYQLLHGNGKEASQWDLRPPYVEATDGTKLFNYVEDPTGQNDLSGEYADVTSRLSSIAHRYMDLALPVYEETGEDGLSEEETNDVRRRLAQLGYLSESDGENSSQEGSLDGMASEEVGGREPAKVRLTARLQAKERELRSKDHEIAALQQRVSQLELLSSSLSWRLTSPLRKGFTILSRLTGTSRKPSDSKG